MNSKPKISIIMPSLNVAKFIRECIDSVVNQTLKNIEIICVDAGSTDGTEEILLEYEKSDSRIHFIHSDIKSYGYQMNLGLDFSHGEFIGIVETDDWIEPDAFSYLVGTAEDNKVDFVRANYYWYRTTPQVSNQKFENLKQCKYNTVLKDYDLIQVMKTAPSIWSGIYRTSFIKEKGIRFNETPGASYQDTSFHFLICASAKSGYLVDKYFLHYRRDNEGSSVNTDGKVYCVSDETHYFEDRIKEIKATIPYDLFMEEYMPIKYEKYRWNYARIGAQYQWGFLSLIHNEFLKHKQDGYLRENQFSKNDWEALNNIIDNPVKYFTNTCKKYCTRPRGEQLPRPTLIKQSRVENPDVSIIIPGYNEERFIEECIQSALKQTYNNIEIICVDDGSTDSTLKIMLDAASEDDRVTVLHQDNMGLSVSRNNGLDIAKGRCVMFIDADDSIDLHTVEELMEIEEAGCFDVLTYDGRSVYQPSELINQFPYYEHAYEYDYSMSKPTTGKDYFTIAIENDKYRTSACFALYRTQFLRDNNIKFIEGIIHEDNPFSFEVFMKAKSVFHTTGQYYIRRVHNETTMTGQKQFTHVYGFIQTFIYMSSLINMVEYNERLNNAARKELVHIRTQIVNTYNALKDKQLCRNKMNCSELLVLDSAIESATVSGLRNDISRKDREIKNKNSAMKAVKESISFKIGRTVTWPGRKLRNAVRGIKKYGLVYIAYKLNGIKPDWKNSAPKVLFVSSDAYKMSGAFLSEIALNKLLRDRKKIETSIILPYHGSGNYLVNEAKIKNTVIESKDWVIDKGHILSKAEKWQKRKEHISNCLAALNIARYALKGGYNIIHSNTTYTYVGHLASKYSGIPHIWHLREFLDLDQNKQIYCEEKGHKWISKSKQVITISHSLLEKTKSFVPEKKLKLIYNGVDRNKYYVPNKPILEKKPIFLFVSGSSSDNKGRYDLVEACKTLNFQGLDFELWFVGWCGEPLQKSVKEAGLWEKTRFFGYQQDTTEYYKRADIFFMCSKFEAFGRTTVEASMGGCLIIGADSAATQELISDGETGYLYPYGDIDKLTDCICRALNERGSSKAIAAKCQKYMLDNFTAESNCDHIYDAYREIIGDSRPHGWLSKLLIRIKIAALTLCYSIGKAVVYVGAKLCGKSVESEVNNNTVTSTQKTQVDTQPLVSVIVPIYNVANYLEQCLSSICDQTLTNIEIICVNDGSTDNSLEIINHFATLDNRVKVIDKPNAGYGNSCNMGIAAATGEYIAIVEPDDFIDKNMYRDLYSLAKERGSVDIIKGSYWMYYDTEDGKGETKTAPINAACHPLISVFSVWEYPEIIYHHPSIWSCLYLRSFLKDNNIKFVEAKGAGWVDNPFLIETFCKAKRVTWTPKQYYFYRQTNPGASSFLKDCTIPFLRTKEMICFLDNNNITDKNVRGSVYKRILYNLAATLENPYYDPEKDDEIIRDQFFEVPEEFLMEKRVSKKEVDAYNEFRNKFNIS